MKTRQGIASVALMLAALAAPAAYGQSTQEALKGMSVDELKQVYLLCDSATNNGRLDTAGIMQCSIVYEELKQRAFGGDFEALFAWSKTQQSPQVAGR